MTAAPPARPWLTGTVVLAAGASLLVPALDSVLVYDRARILGGEFWRLWTGHLVHIGAAHLGWNLLVLGPAAVWLERGRPGRLRAYLLLAPAAISACLLAGEPRLARYAGLSGLAVGGLVLLALDWLGAERREWRRAGWGLLGLVALKLTLEWGRAAPLFVPLGPETRVVPLAHAAGAVAACLVHFGGRGWARSAANPPPAP